MCQSQKVMTRRLFPLAGDGKRAEASRNPGLEPSRHLLEHILDDGMAVLKRVSFKCSPLLTQHFHDCFFYTNSVLILPALQ